MPEVDRTAAAPRLNLSAIEAALQSRFIGCSNNGRNELWDVIDSTNNRALELAKKGAPEGLFVIGRQQTAGRGRQGKNWISRPDSGIYISYILRPELNPASLPLLSLVAGLSAVEAIEKCLSVSAGLKWVNDLIYEGRKLGGILCEAPGQEAGARDIGSTAIIVGIGLNLSLQETDLPPELQGRTACLDRICNKMIDANALVAELCSSLEWQYNKLKQGNSGAIIEEWVRHSVTIGKRIRALVGNEEIFGMATGLAGSGALIVDCDNGKRIQLHAGEISIRLEDGSYG